LVSVLVEAAPRHATRIALPFKIFETGHKKSAPESTDALEVPKRRQTIRASPKVRYMPRSAACNDYRTHAISAPANFKQPFDRMLQRTRRLLFSAQTNIQALALPSKQAPGPIEHFAQTDATAPCTLLDIAQLQRHQGKALLAPHP
jgi:hypothetical protein